MDLNKVMLIGRLTRDPELKSLPTGRAVATMSLATGRQWKDANGQVQKQTEFHNVVVWAKMAENAAQYLRKGSKVYIEGRLQTRDWTGTDGVKKYRTEIVAENFIMLDGKPSGAPSSAPSAPQNDYYSSSPGPKEVVEEEIKVEDIPF